MSGKLPRGQRGQLGRRAAEGPDQVERVSALDGDEVGEGRGILQIKRPGGNVGAEAGGGGKAADAEQAPDRARRDPLLRCAHGGAPAQLQADGVVHARGLRRTRHLAAFGAAPPERPLAVDMLAGGDRSQHKIAMIRDARRDRHHVDVAIGDQRRPARIRLGRAEGMRGLVGGLLAAGRDGRERQTVQALYGRHMRVAGPAAASVRSDDSDR